jgi:hypothetical protein
MIALNNKNVNHFQQPGNPVVLLAGTGEEVEFGWNFRCTIRRFGWLYPGLSALSALPRPHFAFYTMPKVENLAKMLVDGEPSLRAYPQIANNR